MTITKKPQNVVEFWPFLEQISRVNIYNNPANKNLFNFNLNFTLEINFIYLCRKCLIKDSHTYVYEKEMIKNDGVANVSQRCCFRGGG